MVQIRVSKVRRNAGLRADVIEQFTVRPKVASWTKEPENLGLPPLPHLKIDDDVGSHALIGAVGDKGHVFSTNHGPYSALLPVLQCKVEWSAKNELRVRDEQHKSWVTYPPGTRIRHVNGAWKAVLPRGVCVTLPLS